MLHLNEMPFVMLVNAVHLNISCVANMATSHPFPTYSLPPLADHSFGFTFRLPQVGRSGVEVPVGSKDFYLHNIPTGSGAH